MDLEYHSQCGTPIDLPPHSDCSFNTYSPTIPRQKIGDMLSNNNGESYTQSGTQTSVSVNPDGSTGQSRMVSLCLKLPNGERFQVNMPVDSSLRQIAEHAGKGKEIDLMNCEK